MDNQIFLLNTSLEEKQRLFYNGSHCPYCGNKSEYIDSIEIYRESYGMVFICRPCKAWVNTHNQSQDHAFGSLAKKDLRDLRHQTHQVFDPLWQKKVTGGMKKKPAQIAARKWLAEFLGIDIIVCHIGMFDHDLCRRTIEECKKYILTPEQISHQKQLVQYRIDVVHFLSVEYEYSVQEFNINAMCQLELKRKDGMVFYYHPKRQEGRWENKKKPSPVEDIEKFIIEHFKEKSHA